ncbi:uncharacterized protein [Pseudorasbora parva]|uniref:uncharacterized protein n=1 Tax=Pseudorasbora parva TaxID=51549 RepID=UPI00351F056A
MGKWSERETERSTSRRLLPVWRRSCSRTSVKLTFSRPDSCYHWSGGGVMSRSESIQTDVHHYEPDRRATSVRPPPPIPKKPDQRGKNNLVKQSCDFSPTYEAYEEILASSEPVRTGPSDSDQHLYEEISELLDGLQDGSGVCAAKGKGFSSSSLMELDGDFQVKSGLLPEPLRVAASLRRQDGQRITNSPNAAADNSGAISERSFSEKHCTEFEVIIIYSA